MVARAHLQKSRRSVSSPGARGGTAGAAARYESAQKCWRWPARNPADGDGPDRAPCTLQSCLPPSRRCIHYRRSKKDLQSISSACDSAVCSVCTSRLSQSQTVWLTEFAHWRAPGRISDDDDDVYYYIRWSLKLEGETENMGVWTKERKGISAEILMMMIFN